VIPGVILAAGRSSRMGRPKAQLPLPGGHTVLSRLVWALSRGGVEPIVAVTRGEHSAALPDWAAPAAVSLRIIVNPEPDRGQLSSLQCGLRALDPEAPAALVTLVDVPFVRPATVVDLLAAWHRSHAPLVRLVRGGRHGHPLVMGRVVIDELLGTPDQAAEGARQVIRRYEPDAVELAIGDEGPFLDLDTPEEYERLASRFEPPA
jgi:molybdenum cofactor cytidylyltransferase